MKGEITTDTKETVLLFQMCSLPWGPSCLLKSDDFEGCAQGKLLLPVSLLVAGVTEQRSSPNEVFIDGGEGGSGRRGSRSERPRGSIFLT